MTLDEPTVAEAEVGVLPPRRRHNPRVNPGLTAGREKGEAGEGLQKSADREEEAASSERMAH